MFDLIPLFIVVPLASAFVILLLNVFLSERAGEVVGDIVATLATAFLLIFSLLFYDKTGIYEIGMWKIPYGINLYLDKLSWVFLVITNTVFFAAILFSINYMSEYTAKAQYYALMLLLLAGLNGTILSGDFFNLFVFVEISALASYSLVGFGTESDELEAAFKYMVLGGIGSAFVLIGVLLVYVRFGLLNMAYVAQAVGGLPQKTDLFLTGTAILFFVGFAIKAAITPFHAWLPDAHPSAPAPVSAILSGVVVKVLGIYTLLRVVGVIFDFAAFSKILIIFGIASVAVGSIMMYSQRDIKRMMAYSTVSNIGMVVICFGVGSTLAIFAGLLHLIYHSIMKSLMFLNAGAVYYATGTRDVRELGGLREQMPVTFGTGAIGAMAMGGMPPFNGFFSKFLMIYATAKSGSLALALFMLAGGILTLTAFIRYLKFVFFQKNPEARPARGHRDVPFSMKASLIFLAVLCIVSIALIHPALKHNIFDNVSNLLINSKIYWSVALK